MRFTITCIAVLTLALQSTPAQDKSSDGWISLFNGKDMTGWKLKSDKYTVTKYADANNNLIPGAKGSDVPVFLTQGLTENNTVADGRSGDIHSMWSSSRASQYGNQPVPDSRNATRSAG